MFIWLLGTFWFGPRDDWQKLSANCNSSAVPISPTQRLCNKYFGYHRALADGVSVSESRWHLGCELSVKVKLKFYRLTTDGNAAANFPVGEIETPEAEETVQKLLSRLRASLFPLRTGSYVPSP
jgi:hypothetical protein